jgi:phosphatidylserine decarboxylase
LILFNTIPGRALLSVVVRPGISRVIGFMMDRSVSRIFISKFIRKNNIKMNEYKNVRFTSFNDFFVRQIKKGMRRFPEDEKDLAAPCDGKLTVYPINADSVYKIKNSIYDVASLLKSEKLAQKFEGGVCLIFRLMPDDYHRYAFIDTGEIIGHKNIKGVLHTVRAIAHERYSIYTQNAREYTVIKTKNFGTMVQMEVGALCVGRIKNHVVDGYVERGEEKGMFEFGGSTIVMLFQEGAVAVDNTIFMNTLKDKETSVRMGETVGRANAE